MQDTGTVERPLRSMTVAVAITLACISTAAAVTTVSTGIKFLAGGKTYQNGYLAGAADMLATLQDVGYLAAERQEEAKRLVRCANTGKIDDLRTAMMQHLEKTPAQAGNNAASTFYVVMRGHCR